MIISEHLICSEFIASVLEIADFVEAAHDFGGHVDINDAAVEEEVGEGGDAAYVHAVVTWHADSTEYTLKFLQKVIYSVHRDLGITEF